jgi:hypothetical protein
MGISTFITSGSDFQQQASSLRDQECELPKALVFHARRIRRIASVVRSNLVGVLNRNDSTCLSAWAKNWTVRAIRGIATADLS